MNKCFDNGNNNSLAAQTTTKDQKENTFNKMSGGVSSGNQNNNLNAPALVVEHSKQWTDIFNIHVNSQNIKMIIF